MPCCRWTLKSSKPQSAQYPRELKTIGDHLRKRRLDLGLLQREVAERIGVDECTVCNWEGRRNVPELRFMPRIIEFLSYAPYDPTVPLSKRLLNCRTCLGLSQRRMAKILGTDPKAIWEWETERRFPSRRSEQRIRRFLACEMPNRSAIRRFRLQSGNNSSSS